MATTKAKQLRVIDGGKAERIDSQPSVRATVLFTPGHLLSVERAADNGDMTRLGDLVDQMLADECIGELLETLATLALSSELTWENGPGLKLGEADLAEPIREDWTAGWSIHELVLFVIYTWLAGFCFARQTWITNIATGRMVPKFVAWHPKHFRYDMTNKTWLWRDERGTETAFVPGDGEWVAGYRRGAFRPWAQGLWRGLSRWWMLKQYAIADWGIHSEKSSKFVLTAGEGVEPSTRKALADDIIKAAKDTIISLPVGFNLELLEISASTRDIYLAQIETSEKAAAVAILGQNLSTNVEGGSFAAAQVHQDKENRKVTYVAQFLGLALQEQSLSFWALHNFGSSDKAPFPRFNTEPPEDKNEKVTTLATLATALVTLKDAGFKLTPQQIEEDYGFKLTEMSAAEIAAMNPVPPSPTSQKPQPGAAGKPKPAGKPAPRR